MKKLEVEKAKLKEEYVNINKDKIVLFQKKKDIYTNEMDEEREREDRKSTRLNSSHGALDSMPSST